MVPALLRSKNHISAGKLLSPPLRAIAGPYLQRLQSLVSSKSWMLSSAFFGAAVTHNNVSDRKQTCLIVNAAVTYRNALTRDIGKSSSLGECRRLPASIGWGAGLGQVSQTYQLLSHLGNNPHSSSCSNSSSPDLKRGGRSSAAQSLPVSLPSLLWKHKTVVVGD